MRLPLQDEQGLLFWPLHQIASLVPEYRHRLRAVHADGRVAHTVGATPFVQTLQDPAGFPHPGPVTPVPPPEPEAPLPNLPVTARQVRYLKGQAAQAWWHTDLGLLNAGTSAEQAARQHPHLIPAGRGTFLNPDRLERLTAEGKRFRLTLDTGEELFVSHGARGPLQQGLELESLYTLDESLDPLYAEGLRDWPYELATASAATLQRDHHDLRQLIANQIWQAFRQPGDYGRDHRGFWYVPLAPTLHRAGLLRELPAEDVRAHDPTYLLYQTVLADLVGRYRLLTYRELGFRDPRPDLRHIGERRPELVVVAEKTSLEDGVLALAREFGVSYVILGGLPSLLSTEFFAAALNQPAVRVVSLVDFDPGGWIAADGFCQQLTRYGTAVTELRHLVTPDRFTAEELELYSAPIDSPTPASAGKVAAWLERSGGIAGEARRMHADHLRPPSRVVEAFRSLT